MAAKRESDPWEGPAACKREELLSLLPCLTNDDSVACVEVVLISLESAALAAAACLPAWL